MKLITLYRCLIGSHAYGLATSGSDFDIRGVAIPEELSYYFGLMNFEQYIGTGEDKVLWSLKKFSGLAAKGNTQTLEMLFDDPKNIQEVNDTFRINFLDNKSKFITKAIFKAVEGYAISEHRKSLGLSSRSLGTNRKEDVKKFGYSRKNASHCIRLLYSGASAITTGVFPVLLPDEIRNICLKLKEGKYALKEFEEVYTDFNNILQLTKETNNVPEKFDYKWLNKIMIDTHRQILNV